MRIVQLCPYAMDRPGGVQRHVRDLSAWLDSQGHAVRILAPPLPGAAPTTRGMETSLGRAIHVGLHGTGFEVSRAARRTIRAAATELRNWGAELVHIHTPWTPFLAAQLWRALDLPTLATIHATPPDPAAKGLTDRYIRWSARRLLPRMQTLVVPSPAPIEALRRIDPALKVHILPPTIDLSRFSRDAPARARRGGPNILFLGRFEPRKGLDIALAAWPHIAETLPDARLTLAGDGPLLPLAERHLSDRVRLIKAPSDAEIPPLMTEADLFLAPAPYGESFGLVLLEVMASGAIPVAAENPGYASVLTGIGRDLLVPPGDAKALAERVIALANPAQQAPYRNWGLDHAAAFDVTAIGPRYLALYAETLTAHASHGAASG